jgi:hypothetical protein
MSQGDPFSIPIQVAITGGSSNPYTKRRSTDRRYFIGGSDATNPEVINMNA